MTDAIVATRIKKPKPIPDRFALVRERELLDLIEALEEGLDNVRSLLDDDDGPILAEDISDIAVDVSAPLKRAIAYLVELRDRNGEGAP